jgi:hypothetical protein
MNESYEQVFLDIISLSLSLTLVKSFSSVSFSLSISINFFRLIAFITSSFLVAEAAAAKVS